MRSNSRMIGAAPACRTGSAPRKLRGAHRLLIAFRGLVKARSHRVSGHPDAASRSVGGAGGPGLNAGAGAAEFVRLPRGRSLRLPAGALDAAGAKQDCLGAVESGKLA